LEPFPCQEPEEEVPPGKAEVKVMTEVRFYYLNFPSWAVEEEEVRR
jgi:hypothetical protein